MCGQDGLLTIPSRGSDTSELTSGQSTGQAHTCAAPTDHSTEGAVEMTPVSRSRVKAVVYMAEPGSG